MKLLLAALLVGITATAPSSTVPPENLVKGTPPDAASAAEGAKKLLGALHSGDPTPAAAFFFPKEAFDLVKDLPVPERYWKKLFRWYQEDIAKEHRRFKSKDWQFDSIELGRCRWKDIGTEGNKVAYWSCVGNFVTTVSDKSKRRFEIRVLINWGKNWYVTHLGPFR